MQIAFSYVYKTLLFLKNIQIMIEIHFIPWEGLCITRSIRKKVQLVKLIW